METLTSHTGKFFEATMASIGLLPDGTTGPYKTTFAVLADTFAQAESLAMVMLASDGSDDIEAQAIRIAPYREVLTSGEHGKFFRVRVKMVTINERTGKEKNSFCSYLVEADSTEMAQRLVNGQVIAGSMLDYEISSITETSVSECLLHNEKDSGHE